MYRSRRLSTLDQGKLTVIVRQSQCIETQADSLFRRMLMLFGDDK